MSHTDVIVVGSGAAGLTAAVTAAASGRRVVVVEKSAHVGGTTAWSGGVAWLPGNPHMRDVGATDTREDALTYIQHVTGNLVDPVMVEAFLTSGPRMVAFLEAHTTSVRFQSFPSPDYHPDLDGAAIKARSVLAVPFDGRLLGSLLARLRRPMRELTVFGGMQADPAEALHLQYSWKRWKSFKVAARLLSRYALDLVRHGRSTRLIRGQALAGRLYKSAHDLGVDLRTDATAERLLTEAGRVCGIAVRTKAGESEIHAKYGVVLASGGFSANAALVARHIPNAAHHIVMLPETNSGDGMAMALSAGAALGGENADNGIWMPSSSNRRRDGSVARYPHFAFDRCKPGAIMVDGRGERFVNEAASYHIVVRAMQARGAVPAWLIGDHRFLRRYGMGLARPFPYPYRRFVRDGYLVQGKTLAELAGKIGVSSAALQSTVARFNGFASSGKDEDFGKGADIYTRMLGDAEHSPNPCLGPIQTAPFYALALYPSDCGTVLGLRTDENARVLRDSGEPIAGLYACGLDMNSVLRGNYPGAGTMIGPAMTFGYVAGRHLAGAAP